jgi:UDPglucose 6-dehydrogenase
MTQVTVIGTGYVGLCTAAGLSSLSHEVVCLDIDEKKVEALSSGVIPIYESGLEALVREGLANNSLDFVSSANENVFAAEFIFLCLPTPSLENGEADLTAIFSVIDAYRASFTPGTILVIKSTVPVGTALLVRERLARSDITVVSNPEFLREGTAMSDFFHPDRIVIGTEDELAFSKMSALYADIPGEVLLTSNKAAEMIKYVSNAFLAVKLSFVNEIASLTNRLEVSNREVMRGFELDHRIGSGFNRPGPGWGGSCFPKDTLALLNMAEREESPLSTLAAAVASNHCFQEKIVQQIIDQLDGIAAPKIAVWGLSFKAGTDDTRESPALAIVTGLIERGVQISAFDPVARVILADGYSQASNMAETTRGASLLLVLTEWPEFKLEKPALHLAQMSKRVVFDTRNILAATWETESDKFLRIG